MPQQLDFDPTVDHYRALGVAATATAAEIKKAYRKLAKANHPDSTGGDKAKESRFKDVSNAYDVLGDPKKRARYDQVRAGGGTRSGSSFGGVYTAQGPGPGIFDLGDLFGQFFTGGASVGGVRIDPAPMRAPPGAGATRGRDERTIRASDGTPLRAVGNNVYSDLRISFDRAILGTVASIATRDGNAEVKVPPGTPSGKKLRLRGKGMPDQAGQAGDHYITVQIDVPSDLDEPSKKLLIDLVTRLRKHERSD